MAEYIDFYSIYIMGSIQVLLGFYFFARLLHKKVRWIYFALFALCGVQMLQVVRYDSTAESGAFALLLVAGGMLLLRADWKSAALYAALVVEVMQLCYGIVSVMLSIFYPLASGFDQNMVGIVFMLSGDVLSLLLSWICCHLVWRYFSYFETIKKQYVVFVLIPILMIFIMDEYIHSFVYGFVVTDSTGVTVYANHYKMLVIQLLAVASLFCILFFYKKLLQNFQLTTELTLLEQEEHSLCQYVEEARAHYEKTKAFRHDIKNHMAVLRELLQSGKLEQALDYIGDMDELAGELSFPCSTNNPVVDLLVGKKLGIAKSMGIDVCCSLVLPYPCGLRDMDVCVILSNALDNAVHACKQMEQGAEKYISITGRMQGDFLFMEVENSFRGNGVLKQGTGLSNVKAVAEKYHGAVSMKVQRNVFVLNVLLIIPQDG